jgi:hypothetical protein
MQYGMRSVLRLCKNALPFPFAKNEQEEKSGLIRFTKNSREDIWKIGPCAKAYYRRTYVLNSPLPSVTRKFP